MKTPERFDEFGDLLYPPFTLTDEQLERLTAAQWDARRPQFQAWKAIYNPEPANA